MTNVTSRTGRGDSFNCVHSKWRGMHGCCFPWNSVRTHGRNWAFRVSLIEASTSGETGPRFHILSPWIFQNHSPLHLMSVTNFPLQNCWEKPCATEIARCIKIESWKPTHHPWFPTLWMTVMLSLERWFQEVLVLYLPVDSWVRIPVALVPASLRLGENWFFWRKKHQLIL